MMHAAVADASNERVISNWLLVDISCQVHCRSLCLASSCLYCLLCC